MTSNQHRTPIVPATNEVKWGETRNDHYGYDTEEERISKRGLEDWELVEQMTESGDHRVPYWFIGLFFMLLFIAIGLTFPFWGVRPGYERPWFDWGIVIGTIWVLAMSAIIYYFVDYRHQRKVQKERALREHNKGEV